MNVQVINLYVVEELIAFSFIKTLELFLINLKGVCLL